MRKAPTTRMLTSKSTPSATSPLERHLVDILEQPSLLEGVATYYSGNEGRRALRSAGGRRPGLVLFTGMGSSLHASTMAASLLANTGVYAFARPTSELIHYETGLLSEDVQLVVTSQSGESIEVQRLLELRPPCSIIGIANDPESTLARSADVFLPIRAGEEEAVSSKTYTTSLAVLYLLSQSIAQQATPSPDDLRSIAARQQQILDSRTAWLPGLVDAIQPRTRVYFLGRGPGMATAGQAALTTKELVKMPAEFMGAADFRHGPFEIVGPDLSVIVIAPPGLTSALNWGMARDISAAGGHALVVSLGRVLEPNAVAPAYASEFNEFLSPLLDILPLQLLAHGLTLARGQKMVFRHASKVTLVE